MSLTTRRPTGKPAWPILLIAGGEKAGKTYSAAEASASPLVGRTLWVSIGEDEPDEYGAIPGTDFEIVAHDGTYRGILATLRAASAEPVTDQPNLLVLDSTTRLWDLLCDMAQAEANRRARIKAEKYHRPVPDDDVTIGMDLWNTAKQRWAHVLDVLRDHDGPSILTARLEQTVVVDSKGDPTKDKVWKVKAEKGLPFDAGVIVEMPTFGEVYLTGVRSLRFKPEPGARTAMKDFTVDDLWRRLGLADEDGTSPRQHTSNDAQGEQREIAAAPRRDELLIEVAAACEAVGFTRADIAQRWLEEHSEPIQTTTNLAGLEELLAGLAKAQRPDENGAVV